MDESEDEDVVVPTSVYDVGKDVDYNDPCFPSNIKIGRHMRIGQTPHVSTFSAIYCQCTVDGDPNHIAKVYNLSKLPAKPTDEQKESSYLWNLRMYSFLGESGIGLPVVTAFKCNSKIFYDMTSRETVTNISKGMPCFFVVMKGFSISLHDFYEGFIERDLIDTFKTTFYPQIATLLAKKVDWMHSLKFIHTEIHRKDVLLHFDSKETQVLDLHFIGFEDSYYRGMDRFGEEEDEEGLEEMSENNFVFTEDEDDQDEKDIWILTTHHKSDEENQGRTQDEEEYDPASEYHDPAGDHEYYYRRYYYNYDKERNNNNNNNNNNNSRVSATLLLSQKYTEVANHAISNLVKYMVDHRVNGIKVNEINFMYRDLMEVHNRINANGMSELAYPTTKTKKIFDTDKLMKMSSTDRSNVAQSISILSMMRNSQQQQQQKGNNKHLFDELHKTLSSIEGKRRKGEDEDWGSNDNDDNNNNKNSNQRKFVHPRRHLIETEYCHLLLFTYSTIEDPKFGGWRIPLHEISNDLMADLQHTSKKYYDGRTSPLWSSNKVDTVNDKISTRVFRRILRYDMKVPEMKNEYHFPYEMLFDDDLRNGLLSKPCHLTIVLQMHANP